MAGASNSKQPLKERVCLKGPLWPVLALSRDLLCMHATDGLNEISEM